MKPHLCFVAAALGMYFFALNTTAHAQQVKAETGGVAIGRDIIQSTVVIGIPQEKVDLNERQVRAALAVLGDNDIPPERLAAKLVEIAERFKVLQETASAQSGDDPKIVALKTDAQEAIEVGQLAKADLGVFAQRPKSCAKLQKPSVSLAELNIGIES